MWLLLLACTRDPNLYGYWDVTRWTVGDGDDAVEVTDVGNVEFTADGAGVFVFSYYYDGNRLVPDAHPSAVKLPVELEHRAADPEQIFGSYQSDGERYYMNINGYYEVREWTGGSMVLNANKAAPYGTWDQVSYDAYSLPVFSYELPAEMELLR